MATPNSTDQGVPSFNYPFIDQSGNMSFAWYHFFVNVWKRLGGGSSVGNVQSITVNSTGGIASSVTNPTSTAVINLALDQTQLNLFTATTNGVVPASGGGTTKFLNANGGWVVAPGTGTVTNVSVIPNNGITSSVANPTSTPAITLGLGAITPTSVASSGPVSGTDATFSGNIEFGTFATLSLTQTGYITIKDSGGITRRLLVG